MDLITKELLNKEIIGNIDFANQILTAFSNEELFEKIDSVINVCEMKSTGLGLFRSLIQEQNDSDTEKYIQQLTDAINFFDEMQTMMHMIECTYKGIVNGTKHYISNLDEKED